MKNKISWRPVGQLLSLMAFPATIFYLSPVIPLLGASAGVLTASPVVWGGLFLSSLFLGRGFCGWLCPTGALQECCFRARNTPYGGGSRDTIKYVVLGIWVLLFARTASHAGGITTFDFFFQTHRGLSATSWETYIPFFAVCALVAGLSAAFGKRMSCHSLCWLAPILMAGDRLRHVLRLPGPRLWIRPAQCTHCGLCSKACPMSLSVVPVDPGTTGVPGGPATVLRHAECILCGECATACPTGALSLGATPGTVRAERAVPRPGGEDRSENSLPGIFSEDLPPSEPRPMESPAAPPRLP